MAKKVPAERKTKPTRSSKPSKSSAPSLALDPRLRRLAQQVHDKVRMKLDLTRGFLATAEELDLAAATPGQMTKRVLVLLHQADIPEEFADLAWTHLVDKMYAVSVPTDRLDSLGQHPAVRYVEAGRALAPTLDTSVPETRADRVQRAPANLRGQGTIVGIIDVGGLDFTLDDFRRPDGTSRVLFLWDQNLRPQGTERSPAGHNFGVEYDAATINQALGQTNPFARVRHQVSPGSHATHVTSTAAGNGRSADAAFPANRFRGVATEADIIFVGAGTETGIRSFTDSVRVAEATAYIFRRAAELRRPCIINMSLGQNGGSHDGESIVERAIDRLLEEPGRVFVCAAGNEHVFRGHASGILATGGTRTLRWRVGGGLPGTGFSTGPLGDRTNNEMEIWYSSQDVLRVSVTSPSGRTVGPVNVGTTSNQTLPNGNTVFVDSVRFSPLNGDSQIYVEVSPPLNGNVEAGEWTVRLEAVSVRNGRFDAWIERDARDDRNRFADQSFFVGADFDPVMTLGTPATGRRSIAVANYDHRTETPAGSSGRGPTRDGRTKPELAAPGTDIVAAHALGGRPRGNGLPGNFPMRLPMSGTSMAAPHVAGIAALLLQRNPRLTAPQIRKVLIAATRPVTGAANFDAAWGFGRVDAEAAVGLVP